MDPTLLLSPEVLAGLGVSPVLVALVVVVSRWLLPAVPAGRPWTKAARRGVVGLLCLLVASGQIGAGVRPSLAPEPWWTALVVLWMGTTGAAILGFHVARVVTRDDPARGDGPRPAGEDEP